MRGRVIHHGFFIIAREGRGNPALFICRGPVVQCPRTGPANANGTASATGAAGRSSDRGMMICGVRAARQKTRFIKTRLCRNPEDENPKPKKCCRHRQK